MEHVTLRKVRSVCRSNADAIVVTLFRDPGGDVCGWYLGPVRLRPDGLSLPYLAMSEGVLGAVAVVRALELADEIGHEVCLVDPEDLWDDAWAA